MLLLAFAPNYALVLLAVIFVGLGSAAFHPEGSRVAHMATGSRKGLGAAAIRTCNPNLSGIRQILVQFGHDQLLCLLPARCLGLTINQAQTYIFLFLGAGAGTFFGGPLADRFGKRNLILFLILGTLGNLIDVYGIELIMKICGFCRFSASSRICCQATVKNRVRKQDLLS